MTQRERFEKDLEDLLIGRWVKCTNPDGSFFNGMCNNVAVWDGEVILHVGDKQFRYEEDLVHEHVKLLTHGDHNPADE